MPIIEKKRYIRLVFRYPNFENDGHNSHLVFGILIRCQFPQIITRNHEEPQLSPSSPSSSSPSPFSSFSLLEQFMMESESLSNYIETSRKYELVLYNVKELDTPPLLKHYSKKDGIHINKIKFGKANENENKNENENEKRKEMIMIHSNVTKFSNRNMYKTFIHYLQLDNPGPIPKHLQTIITEKPKLYNHRLTLNEKIEILQKEENVYNNQNFNLLLKVATNVKKENINKEDKDKDNDENIDTSLFFHSVFLGIFFVCEQYIVTFITVIMKCCDIFFQLLYFCTGDRFQLYMIFIIIFFKNVASFVIINRFPFT